MKIFDTLTKRKVKLEPLKKNCVGIYLCGPTVYDYGHLGHGRSAIVFDVLRRFLVYKDFSVTFVRNWTDIDDKTIERAKEEGISVRELTEKFIDIYEEDFEKLNIQKPNFDPKPTEHIEEIINLIKELYDNGHAYTLEDGVYYDISTFSEYGILSGQNIEELKQGVRIEVSGQKKNPGDFVLWKFEKPGEPSWDSPWGKGRPGWHIECSAMSIKYLGTIFDIHCGGQDLIFPHHEDEIAQAKGAGCSFARYWMHNGFLNIDNEKMSKSLGNFFTLREVFEKYSPLTVRFFLLSAHYRSPLNFSEENLLHAQSTLKRYNDFIVRINELAERKQGQEGKAGRNIKKLIDDAQRGFEEGLEDDLNISRSLASISNFIRDVNTLMGKEELLPDDAMGILEFFNRINSVLGVFTFKREILAEEIEERIEERERARREKDYQRADQLREELLDMGIILEDTREGTRWKKA